MQTSFLFVVASSLALWSLPPVASAQGEVAPASKRLTYEDTQRPIAWMGSVPSARIAWDGRHIDILTRKTTVWFDPATKTEGPAETQPEGPAGDAAAVAKVWRATVRDGDLWIEPRREGGQGGRGRRGRGARSGEQTPGEAAVCVTSDGAAAGAKVEAHCNAAGTFASFVRGGDFFVVDCSDKSQWRVTDDGQKDQLHGVLDWVYQEEVYGRGDFQGHWWSDTGALVAVLSLDEAPVREFTIVNHVPPGYLDTERTVATEVTNYPKAGDPNPIATLLVVDGKARTVTPVDLSAYPKDVLVVRVEWAAGRLLVTLQDRVQTWAELCMVDVATGKVVKWLREESKTWTNRPESPRWLADGTFLWLSERTGFQHVYHYRAGGELLNAVTSGDWQVRSIERVDEARGRLWFEGTRDGAAGRHIYRVGLDGKDLRLLTPGVGTHQAEFDRDASYLLDRWSAMDQPMIVRVLDGETGEPVHEIGRANTGQAAEYSLVAKERLSIPTRDGEQLDASLMLPPDAKPGARHPIYLPTYSGPDSPSVRDVWGPSTYQQFVAQQGFAVLQVNVRSASGRGLAATGTCYRHLGEQELADLEDAIAWVCKERSGDPARVAIEGWSYGGFMAAYALTHSDKFALGLAGAGVYDWRLYDTIYTERYMGLPDDNQQGYDHTSVIKSAKNLRGHLVLLHGTMDDNVHLQNTMQLLWELEKAGKQNFELMLYPRSQHGLAREVSAHSREFAWRHLQRLLDPAWKAE